MPIKRSHRLKLSRGLIRMSWSKYNLYMLATKPRNLIATTGRNSSSRKTVFQQQFLAKKETRAYHDSHITEKTWLKVFNENLPAISTKLTRQKQNSKNQQHISPTSLLYADLERRVDFIVFRSHFASSVWNARRMVLQGHVKLNGKVFRKPGHRVSDGDVITVDPYVIPTLVDPVNSKSTENSKQDQPQESTESQDTPTTLSENETKSQAESGTESVILNTLKKTRGEHYAFKPFPYQQPFMFLPEYLEVNYNICSTMFLRSPTLKPNGSNCDLPSPFPPDLHSLAYLYYLKRGRRSSRV